MERGWLACALRRFSWQIKGRAAVQRLESVAAGSWVYGAWHEAVIGLPGCAAASMTGIVGAAVILRGRL